MTHRNTLEIGMGLAYADVKLSNEWRRLSLNVKALVDTGALFLCIPESVAVQLGYDLTEVRRRQATLADGSTRTVPVVPAVLLEFENRWYSGEAMVIGDEPLIGCIPMEAMDVIVEPRTQRMMVNPAHPNVAVTHVK
jgi:clan AA aspartic protease